MFREERESCASLRKEKERVYTSKVLNEKKKAFIEKRSHSHIYIYRLLIFIYIIERWKVSFCSVSLFPLDSPKTSFATDVIQWAISFYIELASSPNFHSVSLIIFSLNITCLSPFQFHHLILGSLAPSLPSLNTKIEYSKSMLGCYTLSRYHPYNPWNTSDLLVALGRSQSD